jgi:hypothetical protein
MTICDYKLGWSISVAFAAPSFYALCCHKRNFFGSQVCCDIPEINSQINNELTGAFLNRQEK